VEEEEPGSAFEDSPPRFLALNLGAGASGFEESEFVAGSLSAEALQERIWSSVAVAVEDVVAARGVLADKAEQQNKRTVERIKNHLISMQTVRGRLGTANELTLLYQRTGVTGPLVTVKLVLS